ncbi:MAG: hypothetical protein J6O50_01320 [Ruminiclostridium sp.]|nr:hypothetical protein [Ruminiclostridium sp.]
MERVMKFLKTDNGKLFAVIAVIALILLFIGAATPNTINMCINNGDNCVVSTRSAKRINKGKRKKDKKNGKAKKNS